MDVGEKLFRVLDIVSTRLIAYINSIQCFNGTEIMLFDLFMKLYVVLGRFIIASLGVFI